VKFEIDRVGVVEFCGCASVGHISVFCAKHEPPHGKATIKPVADDAFDEADEYYAHQVELMKDRAPA
jgi:hypothetical protein